MSPSSNVAVVASLKNNEGVLALSGGNVPTATICFISALTALNATTSSSRRRNPTPSSPTNVIQQENHAVELTVEPHQALLQQETVTQSRALTPEEPPPDINHRVLATPSRRNSANNASPLHPPVFAISKSAILLAVKKQNGKLRASSPVEEIRSVLTFNLALCYQILGCSSCGPPDARATECRRRAIRYYTESYDIRRCNQQRQQQQQHNEAKQCKPSLFDLSILNNIGVLLFQVGHADQARSCLEQLAFGLSQVDASSKMHAEFVTNLTLLLPESILAAAA